MPHSTQHPRVSSSSLPRPSRSRRPLLRPSSGYHPSPSRSSQASPISSNRRSQCHLHRRRSQCRLCRAFWRPWRTSPLCNNGTMAARHRPPRHLLLRHLLPRHPPPRDPPPRHPSHLRQPSLHRTQTRASNSPVSSASPDSQDAHKSKESRRESSGDWKQDKHRPPALQRTPTRRREPSLHQMRLTTCTASWMSSRVTSYKTCEVHQGGCRRSMRMRASHSIGPTCTVAYGLRQSALRERRLFEQI